MKNILMKKGQEIAQKSANHQVQLDVAWLQPETFVPLFYIFHFFRKPLKDDNILIFEKQTQNSGQ